MCLVLHKRYRFSLGEKEEKTTVMESQLSCYRGDIFNADLGAGLGSEQQGERPVIVVQNNDGNSISPTVIVAPCTTQGIYKKKLPTHCTFDNMQGVSRPSTVLLEQMRAVDKQRLLTKLGRLTRDQMDEINKHILISFGFIRPEPESLEICLCPKCLNAFWNTQKYIIRRKNPYQTVLDPCTYCGTGKGYDYFVFQRKKR